ncbi:class F sortase [Kutzneria viridogrisea]|uniref:Peptidase C60 sortase A and B n=2 Tax=Kutzneria TaxID=43356 RepID=W5WM23_9PSEU|nr:class F sortase [Kutzneria albida]AHI01831.1 hypothetical protein KALB_8474 [Kutzneria albida DSM 43870]MBA8929751.1 LPXTG-site transpeptidase (sortase) family protein [Kutzneria viridogrisea]
MRRTAHRLLAAAVVLGAAAGLAACGSPQEPPATGGATTTTAQAAPAPKVRPTEVRVPKIGAQSSLITTGLNTDGTLEVPPVDKPMQASWFRLSPTPGDTGPAVILGHVDGNKEPGVFFKLRELKAGDEVFVRRADAKEVKFLVDHVEQVPKDQFPQDRVYSNTEKPELRLITCGGAFDHAEHNYKDNIVVFAKLAA